MESLEKWISNAVSHVRAFPDLGPARVHGRD